MLTSSVPLLVLAAALVVAAGGFAAADAALGTVSRARVDALVRSGRFGASALALVIADRPRHVNLLLLLRLSCELTATVLVTVAALRALTPIWLAVLVTGIGHGGGDLRRRREWVRAPSGASTLMPSASPWPDRSGCWAGSWGRCRGCSFALVTRSRPVEVSLRARSARRSSSASWWIWRASAAW